MITTWQCSVYWDNLSQSYESLWQNYQKSAHDVNHRIASII